jgi:transposase InsO family protein
LDAGSRMLRDMLKREAYQIGRKHVATLMKKMGIEALYKKPNTSRRHPAHPVYPYLLRNLEITRPNHVFAADITYIPMKRGFKSRLIERGFQGGKDFRFESIEEYLLESRDGAWLAVAAQTTQQ